MVPPATREAVLGLRPPSSSLADPYAGGIKDWRPLEGRSGTICLCAAAVSD
jgi:hypothetical protein